MLPPPTINQLTANSCVQNIALIICTIIALPVGMANKRNDGHFIFATVENLTTWPTGWAFMLAWLSPIWTIGAFDSCVHMSEEASNAAKAVPLGILSSIGMCWGLGFVIVIVLAACIDPNIENVLGSSFGQPVSKPGLCSIIQVFNANDFATDGSDLLRRIGETGCHGIYRLSIHCAISNGVLHHNSRLAPDGKQLLDSILTPSRRNTSLYGICFKELVTVLALKQAMTILWPFSPLIYMELFPWSFDS
jgi:hypothetical protein